MQSEDFLLPAFVGKKKELKEMAAMLLRLKTKQTQKERD
jgi:hypothetical protein